MSRKPDSIDAQESRRQPAQRADTAERRGAARMGVREPATLETSDDDMPVRLLEVSAKGARIQVDAGVEFTSDVVALTIPFTRDPAEAERFVARIVHRSGDTIGLHWMEAPSFDARFKLARLMERERGTPIVLIGALPMLLWPPGRARER